jgi:hypothetical protein
MAKQLCKVNCVRFSESKSGMPFIIVELETPDGKRADKIFYLSEKAFEYSIKDLNKLGMTFVELSDLENVADLFPGEVWATIEQDGKYLRANYLSLEDSTVVSSKSNVGNLGKFAHIAKAFGNQPTQSFDDPPPAKLDPNGLGEDSLSPDDLPF